MKLIEKPVRVLPKDLPTINDRIEYLRCVLGYPEKQFASKIGSSYQTVRKVLRDQVLPQLSTVNTISILLHAQSSWLLTGIGKPFLEDYKKYIYTDQSLASEDVIDYDVNRRIRQIREGLEMTQPIFADAIGVTKNQLVAIENERNSVSIPVLKRIIVRLKIKPQWLLFGTGNRNNPAALE